MQMHFFESWKSDCNGFYVLVTVKMTHWLGKFKIFNGQKVKVFHYFWFHPLPLLLVLYGDFSEVYVWPLISLELHNSVDFLFFDPFWIFINLCIFIDLQLSIILFFEKREKWLVFRPPPRLDTLMSHVTITAGFHLWICRITHIFDDS